MRCYLRVSMMVFFSLIPLVILFVKIYDYGFFFPFWDEWHLAPLIEKSFRGTLSTRDLWELHNGHRLIVSKALLVAIARMTGWQVGYELILSVVLALLSLVMIYKMCLSSAGISWSSFAGLQKTLWLLPVLSMLVFSWAQMENWVWGWQVLLFLSLAAVVAGFALLSDQRLLWSRVFLAIVFGVVASFSFGSGLVFWIAALPILVGPSGEQRIRKIIRLLVWLLASTLTFRLFFFDYPSAGEWGPDVTRAIAHPAQFVYFVVLEIGNPIAGFFLMPVHMNSDIAGRAHYVVASGVALVGLVTFVCISWVSVRRCRISMSRLSPLMALAAFAVGSAMLAGLSRSVVGLHQALSSRYISLTTLFWCALAGLIAAVCASQQSSPHRPQTKKTTVAAVIALAVFVLAEVSVFHVNTLWEEIAGWKRLAWTSLRVGNEVPAFANQLHFPGDRVLTQYLPIAKQRNLIGFGTEFEADPELAETFFKMAARAARENQIETARAYLRTALILAPEYEAARQLEVDLVR